ncbi:MAG TPA: AAA family ATPase [Longimicrobiales bacterium]
MAFITKETDEPVALAGEEELALAERMREAGERISAELRKRIIGQEAVVEQMLLSLFAGGNSLIVGVPGLAKTLLVRTLAEVLSLDFSRIQFTPDLMPSDITGTDILQEDAETGRRALTFAPGPIFANIVLADEINRTPPKTQAALLEAMQEHRVTVQGRTYELKEPFFVFATQNPIELEGTYPLPEAQLDRFMFEIVIGHLPEEDELEVVRTTTAIQDDALEAVVTGDEILSFQRLVRRVPVADPVLRYALALTRATRPGGGPGDASDVAATHGADGGARGRSGARTARDGGALDFIDQWVAYGASVRAAQYLTLGGKARALLHGRTHVGFQDIRALAHPVLRHRVLTNFHAEAERITADAIIDRLLEAVPPPASGM